MNPSIHAARVLPARAVLFLGIVGLHALLAYLFATGLIMQTVHILLPDPPIEVFDIKDQKPAPEMPPPSTPPVLTTFKPVVPEAPVDINMPSDAAILLPSDPIVAGDPIARTPTLPPPLRLVGRNVMPNTADYYPPSEIRLGNEGTAEIRSCVDANGRLDGTPTVEATSGRVPLDKAAVRLAQDGKYARAMRGDEPVPNCYRFRVTFTLH